MCCSNRCGDDPAAAAPAPYATGSLLAPSAVPTTTVVAVARNPFPWWLVLVIVLLLATRNKRK